jgi:UDP-N-acetylmuramyl pentapeptide synthase
MLELGDAEDRLHREVAWLGTTQPVDLVIAVGRRMRALAEVYEEHFLEARRGSVWRCDSADEAAEHLLAEVRTGDVVLVKGSHGMKMNRVLDALTTRFGRPETQSIRPTSRERPVGDPLPEVLSERRPAA